MTFPGGRFETRGSFIDGIFVPADAVAKDSCPDDVYYWPKGVPIPDVSAMTALSS